jgi:hypothetical protein
MLWTNSVLVEARRIYGKAGFTLVAREEHHSAYFNTRRRIAFQRYEAQALTHAFLGVDLEQSYRRAPFRCEAQDDSLT